MSSVRVDKKGDEFILVDAMCKLRVGREYAFGGFTLRLTTVAGRFELKCSIDSSESVSYAAEEDGHYLVGPDIYEFERASSAQS